MRFCGEEFKGKRTQRKTSFRFPLDCCVSFFFFFGRLGRLIKGLELGNKV